ncbi:fatty acyl-CoA reductase 1 [Orussus abietinus]|uniref:fatty acyl-CoA reductase 1 n=1 Tax=Orussus abietinus TaxID=222816 RepID=UPI00062658A9|nr:fatty acyl-CoA reductase 1 [Orussus abietinus]
MITAQLNPASSIPAFYAGKSIFITGATGFMGKVLIEKLLRSCPDIREIFLLMRQKKGQSIDDRIRRIVALPLFDKLREQKPSSFEKLIPVTGDVSEEGLGLPAVERRVLIERVSIIFHVAASVRFDDSLKDAIFLNTRSTRDVCILAASMKHLETLVHVSTTYSHTDKPVVKEELYPADVDWKKTIKVAENLDDHVLRILTSKYLGGMPNTYTFTKRLAEFVVADYAGILPIVVFRPSIVISSLEEPIPGWLDNFNGPVGLMIGGGKGILRTVFLEPNVSSDFIPVDVAIKAMITVAWKRGCTTITQDPRIQVFNCSACDIKSISMKELIDMAFSLTAKIPLEGVLWAPHTKLTASKTLYYFLVILLHLLPALLIDGLLKITGRKSMLLKIHRKVYIANSALEYFTKNQWQFKNDNLLKLLDDVSPADKSKFSYDYYSFDICEYFTNCLLGAKKYLLKEDIGNLKEAKAHYDKMWWLDKVVKTWLGLLLTWIIAKSGLLFQIIGAVCSFLDGSMSSDR